MVEIPLLKVHVSKEADAALLKTLHSGFIGQGKKVDEFESELAYFLGVDSEQVVTVNSCTSALKLALRLANVRPGDEVISTPATNLATNSVILDAGAWIKWADIDPDYGQITPVSAAPLVNRRTAAIMMMDWAGQPCLASDWPKVPLIVDAAQSFGALINGWPRTIFADFICHSFGAVKQVNTGGHGGVLICRNKKDAERARLLRWFGLDRRRTSIDDPRCEQMDVSEFGYQMQMNDLMAEIGMANLKDFPKRLDRARENAAYYSERFTRAGISYVEKRSDVSWSPWVFTALPGGNRDELMRSLREKGIGCSKVHARNDTHSAFRNFKTELPGADDFYARQLCIPVGAWVSEQDSKFIADTFIEEYNRINE